MGSEWWWWGEGTGAIPPAWDLPAGPCPSDCVHKALGKQPCTTLLGEKNIWTGARNEPPQTVHVAGMQTLLLQRSTKKPTRKACYRTHSAGSARKAEWVIPTPLPSLYPRPRFISQDNFTAPLRNTCCVSRSQCSKACSTSLYSPNSFPHWELTFFVVQTSGIILWFLSTELFSWDKLFSSLWETLLLSLKEGNP